MNRAFTAADQALALSLFEEVRLSTTDRESPGGITRPSYGCAETSALMIVAKTANEASLDTRIDPVGNLMIALHDGLQQQPAVWIGSHADSVPHGGNYDGFAGIVAGLLVLLKIKELGNNAPVKLIGLRGEESAWFGVPYIGAKALLGRLSAHDLMRLGRGTVATLGEVVRSHGLNTNPIAAGERLVDLSTIKEFWELHIEQGPVLVDAKIPVGIVTGIRGNMRLSGIQCYGVAGHSGAVPKNMRHDAVAAATRLISDLNKAWVILQDHADKDLVFTCGRFFTDAATHTTTRIPDHVTFDLEWRSQDVDVLRKFGNSVNQHMSMLEVEHGVHFEMPEPVFTAPGKIHSALQQRAVNVCRDLEVPCRALASGAGHDAAVFAAEGIPAGMIFVRNDHGSHNPQEAMDIADFMQAVEVLFQVVQSR